MTAAMMTKDCRFIMHSYQLQLTILHARAVIKTYDEIVGTSFGQKIRFLKINKLFKVITDGVSADSRNNIGHLIYTIKPNGNILFDGKLVDYEKSHRWVREVGFSLTIIIQTYYNRYVK